MCSGVYEALRTREEVERVKRKIVLDDDDVRVLSDFVEEKFFGA